MGGDFWSRRRAGVAAEAETDVLEEEQLAAEALDAEKTDEELLEELGLPDPDTLKMGDDFSAFMGKMVPDRLRRRALRVLWRSNPTLANLDALVDYGEDFTDKAMCVENMQTAYQVGKGMLTHVMKMAEEAEAKENPPEEIDEDEEVVLAEAQTEPEPETEVIHSYEFEDTADEEPTPLPPRRMQFSFDDDVRQSA
jgi:hypothetical protein